MEMYTRKWLATSPVSQSPGHSLFKSLEQELDRVNLLSSSDSNNVNPTGFSPIDIEAREYQQQLKQMHNVFADSMMSAVHREIFHYHINGFHNNNHPQQQRNRTTNNNKNQENSSSAASSSNASGAFGLGSFGFRVAFDEDESHIVNDPDGDDDDDDDDDTTCCDDEDDQENSCVSQVEQQDDESQQQNEQSTNRKQIQQQQQKGGVKIPNNNNNANAKQQQQQSQSQQQQEQQQQQQQQPQIDPREKRRQDRKRKRQEDAELLKSKHIKSSEKNLTLSTLGPFPHPRLTVRSLKHGISVPSRKALTQRLQLDQLDQSSSSSEDEEEISNLLSQQHQAYNKETEAAASSSLVVRSKVRGAAEANIFKRLIQFLSGLSNDSLKKVSESAKVKLRTGGNQQQSHLHDEAVHEIAKAAVKFGTEKAQALMDKNNKRLERLAQSLRTNRTGLLTQISTNITGFFGKLNAEQLKSLAPSLGVPAEYVTVTELWERVVALGLFAVLSNLRRGPLKKIAQESPSFENLSLNENYSTEKQCAQIVYSVYPGERLRVRYAKKMKRNPGVSFSVTPEKIHCLEDMGFISFTIHNLSQMKNDAGDRHYSPEFEFGNLRWSLLIMSNKENLALYLCQQGSVHCKFAISVVNHKDDEDSIYNEGTQEFKSSSSENDWGFNNVMKFEELLEAERGFWKKENDSITIECGIVLVECSNPNVENNNNNNGNNNSSNTTNKTNESSNVNNNNNQQAPTTLENQQKEKSQQQQQQQQANVKNNNNNDSNVNINTNEKNKNLSQHQKQGDAIDKNNLLEKNDIANNKVNTNVNNNTNITPTAATKTKSQSKKDKKSQQQQQQEKKDAEFDEMQQRIIQQDRLDTLRKKLKQNLTILQKEEERIRKELSSKGISGFSVISEHSRRDEVRITRELQEREKKEQHERQKEIEKLRSLQDQHSDLKRKLTDLEEESKDISTKKENVGAETKSLKSQVTNQRQEVKSIETTVGESQNKFNEMQEKLEERKRRLETLKARIEALPAVVEGAAESFAEDNEIMKSVQQSLANIIEFE